MTNSPLIWNIGEDIPIELFVGDPDDGTGLTGQTSFITLTIQRTSDNKYWNGTNWVSTLSTLSMTEASAVNQPGRYTYTLDGSTGNPSANRYIAHVSISNPPTIEGDSYETHVSRDLELRIYESEPS